MPIYQANLFQYVLFPHQLLSVSIWILNRNIKDVFSSSVMFRHEVNKIR